MVVAPVETELTFGETPRARLAGEGVGVAHGHHEQTPGAVTLLNAKNERTVVPRETIETMQESAVSLMPEGMLKPLRPDELRDLFSYLQKD